MCFRHPPESSGLLGFVWVLVWVLPRFSFLRGFGYAVFEWMRIQNSSIVPVLPLKFPTMVILSFEVRILFRYLLNSKQTCMFKSLLDQIQRWVALRPILKEFKSSQHNKENSNCTHGQMHGTQGARIAKWLGTWSLGQENPGFKFQLNSLLACAFGKIHSTLLASVFPSVKWVIKAVPILQL